MKEKGMNFSEAFNFVQTKRDKAFPNIGFIRQLKDYEKELNFQKKYDCLIKIIVILIYLIFNILLIFYLNISLKFKLKN